MSWLKIDDAFTRNRKITALSHPAFRLHLTGLCYCAANLTDGEVPSTSLRIILAEASTTKRYVEELCHAGLWKPTQDGWQIKDFLEYNPSRSEVEGVRESGRRRQALHRNPALRDAIRQRDGGRCRYCGVEVHWDDRRGGTGGTYDHVDPKGPNVYENVVVSCRACNARKGSRIPSDAGLTLLPAPNVTGTEPVSARNVRKSRPDPAPVKEKTHVTHETHGVENGFGNLAPVAELDRLRRAVTG